MNDSVLLPGGILRDGQRQRTACFHPITGAVEMAIASCNRDSISRPAWVTRVLVASVNNIGDMPMNCSLAEELAAGDRIFLMLQLGMRLHGNDTWMTGSCGSCSKQFDLHIDRASVAVRNASPDYPVACVDVHGEKVFVRAPTGADQQWLCNHRPAHPRRALLARCLVTAEGTAVDDTFINGLSTADESPIASVIEAMGPEVDCTLDFSCPECGEEQQIMFDPCQLNGSSGELDEEIHTLAYYYHWSERDILSITRERRQRYLSMIEKEGGQHG